MFIELTVLPTPAFILYVAVKINARVGMRLATLRYGRVHTDWFFTG